jgi:HEAT repeat protein
MGTSRDVLYLRHVLELCKSGSHIPVETVEALIAGDAAAEPILIDLVRSRAIREDAWGPLWAIVVLGERRSAAGLPAILDAARTENDIVHEGVEFALGRYGAEAVDPILAFLRDNPGLDGRVHLYSALARTRDRRALDYLIRQLRLDEDCMGAIAWALAETRDPKAVASLEAIAARFGQRDPELVEALEAAVNPPAEEAAPVEDWRSHWTWLDEEQAETAEEAGEPQAAAAEEEGEGPTYQPRCYDVKCPACRSELEYDTTDGTVKVIQRNSERRAS